MKKILLKKQGTVPRQKIDASLTGQIECNHVDLGKLFAGKVAGSIRRFEF